MLARGGGPLESPGVLAWGGPLESPGVLARGGGPLESPGVLAWGADPPGTPRWPKAPLLRHGALALEDPDGVGQCAGGQVFQAEHDAAEGLGQRGGQAQPDRARLAVDDHAVHPRRRQQRRRPVRAGHRVRATGGAAVGDQHQQGTAARVADAFGAEQFAGPDQARRKRGPPVGSADSRPAAASTENVGGSASSAPPPRNVTMPTLSRRW